MQSFCRSLIRRQTLTSSSYFTVTHFKSVGASLAIKNNGSNFHGFNGVTTSKDHLFGSFHHFNLKKSGTGMDTLTLSSGCNCRSSSLCFRKDAIPPLPRRNMTTTGNSVESATTVPSASTVNAAPNIKFKRLDKTARHIMQILDKEAVQEVKTQREIPDIRPGYIVQLKVEVPENKRRVSIVKGIVIARRNAGLNTTFRLRRLVAGVGVESLFPLYSPNIKEIKVLDKKKVRRAKLYYLRDKMNALKKQ
ncbi:50S ribosomal protein L19, putative [Ricinus communis]|uniref:50S ribosomal protein L19, putative n=2 Tax=Ricinus communis TaxID=3988 RepID=B9S1T8_RICCO|nr:50S ribosomal protein L19, putative [Ricinus communis]|eukprot:XP_002519953.1 50S ribosomal protein L19, chloroplastic [Ricinus communis]